MADFRQVGPSVEEQMPQAVVGVPWVLALPWLIGLLIYYVLKAIVYLVGFTVVLVIAVVVAVRESRR